MKAYRATFPNFKYKPLSFIFVEIGTNSKTLATPSMVQPIATSKLISPLRGGIGLKIIPSHVQTFTLHFQITTITIEPVRGSEKYVKEQAKLIDPSFIVLDRGVGPLEFLSTSLLLTPHEIGIGEEITLISSTPHVLKVFTTPIVTFEETHDR
jgi:hypothetical protein